MNRLETFLALAALLSQVVLCGFVFARKLQRTLPLFAAYAYVLLACTIVVLLTYEFSGYDSLVSYYVYWGSVFVEGVALSLAIAELCHYGLRAYRGIWALVWRVLAGLSALLVARAVMDAWQQPNKVAIAVATLDRDLALASIIVLVVLLIIRNYYGIAFEPLQRSIALGICFICAVDAVANTALRNLYAGALFAWFQESQKALWPSMRPEFLHIGDIWSTTHLGSFMLSIGIWCFALRKPVPAPAADRVLLPAEVYREMSPAINLRLATFNDRLMELLKP